MNSRVAPLLVAVAGLLSFSLGVLLRFHALTVGTAFLHDNRVPNTHDAANIARAGAFHELAIPLLWLGMVLISISACAWLVRGFSPLPGPIEVSRKAHSQNLQPKKETMAQHQL